MKIELEIPDELCPPERIVHIFGGMNLLAVVFPENNGKRKQIVKVQKCNMCGDCCEVLDCEHLGLEANCRPCNLVTSGQIPFVCAAGRPRLERFPNCSVRWKDK